MVKITFSEAGDETEDLLRRAAYESVAAAARPILEPLRCRRHGGELTAVSFESSEEGLQATMDGCCDDFMEEAREALFAGLNLDGNP